MTPPCKWPVPNRPFHGFFNFWGQGQVWAPHYTNVCKISGIWWAIPSLLFNKSFSNLKILFILRRSFLILGDPEAVSRVDKMFVVKVFCKIETSSWALTLAEPVPEAFELPASDWPEKVFLANQRREAAVWLSCLLTRRSFPHRSR